MADVNKDLMERLYNEQKVLVDDIKWHHIGQNTGRYTMRAAVKSTDSDKILTLVGEYYADGRYSFGLRYNNYMIRVWDFNSHHDGIEGGHKHRYPHSEILVEEDDPYNVDHIPTSDPHQAIKEFLEECEIGAGSSNIHQIPGLNQYE